MALASCSIHQTTAVHTVLPREREPRLNETPMEEGDGLEEMRQPLSASGVSS